MNWLAACRCGCGMPAPLSNLIRAIDAPVSSLRHSIFSWMPLSDFSRHATLSDWIRISSRPGAPLGRFIVWYLVSGQGAPQGVQVLWGPSHRLELDQPRQIGDVRPVG